MSDVIGVILRSLEYGSIYALGALGIILVYRTSFTTNFAQATIGMFSTYVVAKSFHSFGINFYLSIILGMVTAILVGIAIDVIIIRRAQNVNALGKQIITLGITSVLLGLSPMLFGVYNLNLPKMIPEGNIVILGAQITANGLFNILFGFILMGGLFLIIQHTKLGLAIKTTASNERIARMMGVPTKSITMFSWAVGGLLALFSGVMAAPYSTVSLTFMNDIQITAFLACVLGGFDTFYGAVIASYIIAIALNLFQVFVPMGTVLGKPVIYSLLLLILYFKPYGIFGSTTVKKV